MPDDLRCRDLYRDGCDRVINGPAWYHEDEWVDHDGRFPGPHIRPGLSERQLRQLAASPETHVRLAVLDYADTPADVVDSLADDVSVNVRSWALRRTRSQTVLLAGAASPDRRTRGDIAANRNTTADVLIRLGSDGDWEVRLAAVINPSAPEQVCLAGANDVDPRVRKWALSKMTSTALLERAASSDDAGDREGVAKNPNVSEAIAVRLASDPNWQVRFALATNRACPGPARQILATDANRAVANMARP